MARRTIRRRPRTLRRSLPLLALVAGCSAATATSPGHVAPARDAVRWTRPDAGAATASAPSPRALAVADLDADGAADVLVVTASGAPAVVLLPGDGRGGLRSASADAFAPPPPAATAVATGDLDGDGVRDVLLAARAGGVASYLGDGAGAFRRAAGDRAGSDAQPVARALALLDWDADGRLDVLAGADVPEAAPSASALTIGDFDDDGRPDFAVAPGTRDRVDLVGLGDGARSWRCEEVAGVPRRSYVRAVHAADVDADGRDELLVGYVRSGARGSLSGVALLERSAAGRWRRRWRFEEPARGGVLALASGDVDGDGARDLVAAGAEGRSWIFLREPRAGFVHTGGLPAVDGCAVAALQVADLDRDGRAEVVAGYGEPTPGPAVSERCAVGVAVWRAGAEE